MTSDHNQKVRLLRVKFLNEIENITESMRQNGIESEEIVFILFTSVISVAAASGIKTEKMRGMVFEMIETVSLAFEEIGLPLDK